MTRFAQGIYIPKNPHKYIGNHQPKYRSSWELVFMTFCDSNENIVHWASEAIKIPYRHPVTGKQTIYVPDFFVVYNNKFGQRIAEVVEIKPKKQSLIESKVATAKDRLIVAINHAKWDAATKYCKRNGYAFRVITEDQIFHTSRR